MQLFYIKFPKFENNDFHASGESYAGKPTMRSILCRAVTHLNIICSQELIYRILDLSFILPTLLFLLSLRESFLLNLCWSGMVLPMPVRHSLHPLLFSGRPLSWLFLDTQFASIPDYACGDSKFAIFDEPTCDNMRSKIPTCQRLTSYCYNNPNRFTCVPATLSCWQVSAVLLEIGWKTYLSDVFFFFWGRVDCSSYSIFRLEPLW